MSVVRMIKDIERRTRALERRSSSAVTGAVRLQNVGGESEYGGGFVAGDVQWNTTTGQPTSGTGGLFNEAGFFGLKAGTPTFSIDFATGDAVFSGTITAGNMSFGVDVSGTNDGIYINATNYWYDTGHFSMANGVITWNGSTLSMTGATIETSTTGYRTRISSGAGIDFLLNTTTKGSIGADSGDTIVYTSAENHTYFSDGLYAFQINTDGVTIASNKFMGFQSGRKFTDMAAYIECDGGFVATGGIDANGGYSQDGDTGLTTTFDSGDGRIVTVRGGIITGVDFP